jgi:hypothetical protein
MRPQRLLAVISIAVLAVICIQQTADAYLVITPQIGVNGSRLTSDPDTLDNKGIRPGWQVGGYLRIGGEKLYFQPGVFWYRISTKLETKETVKDSQVFNNTVDSIQIPLMLGWSIINSGVFNLRLQGGGGVNIITGMDENEKVTKDDLNDTSWLLKAAVGMDIGIFTLDLGYDKGVTDYFKTDVNTGKMDSVVFNLGLRFWM